jgi:ketosteroid isomerase-like protein
MDLPAVAKAYFEADRHNDLNALEAVFSDNASVMDEGTRHEGGAAIRQWWTAAKAKYHHVAIPTETVIAGEEILVRATVTGRFPNSPATLNYAFTVKHGKIINLEIG